MDATPKASVSAVPDSGIMVARLGEVLKVTTVLRTARPVPSRIVAVTLAGLPMLMLVAASPLPGLVKATLMLVAPELEAVTPTPALPVTVAVPRVAEAFTVVAPAAAEFAGSICIAATPLASVRAVPEDGIMLTRVAVVENVTTVLGTTAPVVSRTVADTLADLPMLMLDTVAPVAGSVNARVRLAATVFGTLSPLSLPLTQPIKKSTMPHNNAAGNFRAMEFSISGRIISISDWICRLPFAPSNRSRSGLDL